MKIVLGLGTNLGDREDNLAQGLDRIEKLPKTQVLALSNVYETEPFDVPDEQGAYLNCCVLLETQLEPQALLDKCLTIEKALGRVRKSYHGARTLDIDLLIGEGVHLPDGDPDPAPSPHPGAGLCAGAPVGFVPPPRGQSSAAFPRRLRGRGQVRGVSL